MNYIITSFAYPRAENEPAGWQSLFTSFELGWEVTTTHLLAKRMFFAGIATKDTHCVVTLAGREFLYEGLCNVIPWQRFYEATKYDAIASVAPNVIDLARRFAMRDIKGSEKVFNGSPFFGYRWADDRDKIRDSITTEPVADAPSRFAVACWRYRDGHYECRNTPREVADRINARLVEKFGRVYVVGLGCEPLCNGDTIRFCALPQMAWLVQQDACHQIVGAMTGTTQLAATISTAPVHVYQHNPRQPVNVQNHPAVLGSCANLYSGVRRVWFADETPVEDFIAAL